MPFAVVDEERALHWAERLADTSGSAGKRASGWRSCEGAEARKQLTVGERAALLDRDPSMMTVTLVLGTHVVREVADDFAVTDEQHVVTARHRARNLLEERSHVFVPMTFAGRVLFGGRSPGGAVAPRDGGDDAVAHADLRAPTQHHGRVAGDPDACGVGSGLRRLSFPPMMVSPRRLGGKSRPGATGGRVARVCRMPTGTTCRTA
jgi:hypothetical protein